jgi:membrane protein DedA with SNARE-associated domain
VDAFSDWLIGFISQQNNPIGLVVLGVSALVEYVFPPFPGDTITLFGAILITAYDWSFASVYLCVLGGSVIGAMLAFYFGRSLQKRRLPKQELVDKLVARFERHGAAFLIVNRFLPGFRAVFFVAAGLAKMPAKSVLIYGTVSAALWNLGIIALGTLVGANFARLKLWLTTYAIGVWIAIGIVAVVVAGRGWWKRRRGAA